MRTDRCDVKDCPTLLEEAKGFEVQLSLYVLDRSDRDSDAAIANRHACSLEHASVLLVQTAPKLEAFLETFTAQGKAKRRGPPRK